MTALLGLLAVAGYQNRDKIAEMLKSVTGAAGGQAGTGSGAAAQAGGGLNDLLGRLGGGTSSAPGGFLGGALGELVNSFRQNGQGETIDSWVGTGQNKQIQPDQLRRAISPEVLATLSQQTGMPEDQLLAKLSSELPTAVDQYTPEGRLPSA